MRSMMRRTNNSRKRDCNENEGDGSGRPLYMVDDPIGRCVGRSSNNANANGGLVYANANNASSNSNTNNAARLAN